MNDVPATVGKVLDQISQRFGGTGKYLWDIYVKYTFSQALIYSTGGFIGLASGLFLLYFGTKDWKNQDWDDDCTPAVCLIVGFIVTFAGFMVAFTNLPMMLSPQGAAIASILSR